MHGLASVFAAAIKASGTAEVGASSFFDTVKVKVGAGKAAAVAEAVRATGRNVRVLDADTVSSGKGDMTEKMNHNTVQACEMTSAGSVQQRSSLSGLTDAWCRKSQSRLIRVLHNILRLVSREAASDY